MTKEDGRLKLKERKGGKEGRMREGTEIWKGLIQRKGKERKEVCKVGRKI